MTEKFGIAVSDELAAAIEDHRIREDPDTGEQNIVSRSQVVNEWLEIGRAATELIEEEEDLNLPPGRPRRQWVRQAILDQIRAERR